jgi:hypothetical protein
MKKATYKRSKKTNEEVKPVVAAVKPVEAAKVAVKPAEAAKIVANGDDLYVVLNGKKNKFSTQTSPIYGVKEYFFKGTFAKGDAIKFVRADDTEVPVHHTPNCGYTLVGKAQRLFAANKALIANGEAGDDQQYVYINDRSTLAYVGDSGDHTLFVRVYDNLSGINNDRWVVVYID